MQGVVHDICHKGAGSCVPEGERCGKGGGGAALIIEGGSGHGDHHDSLGFAPLHKGDVAPSGSTLGPLQCTVLCQHLGDPAPIGPPTGPLRRPVEMSGCTGDRTVRGPTLGHKVPANAQGI